MSDIIFTSTYDNILDFIKGKSLKDLVDLHLYIVGTDHMTKPPTEFQEKFIGEFFTHEAWAEWIQRKKRKKEKLFEHRPSFDLPMIQGVLAFEIMKLTEKYIEREFTAEKKLQRLKDKNKTIKKDLENSLDNSYYDGIFDKVDGFSNVYETLIKHKLVKEKNE